MLRVSVVLEILSARISARAVVRSKPSAIAPPTVVALRKVRRDRSKRHLPVEPPRNCPAQHATGRPGCQARQVSSPRAKNGRKQLSSAVRTTFLENAAHV